MVGKAFEQTGRTAEVGRYLSLAAGLDPACSASCSVWAGDTEKGVPKAVTLSMSSRLASVISRNPEFSWPYYLWRLLIDAGQQRRGYGTAALELVVEYVRGRPGAVELVTSAVPGEGSPMPFYARFGFHPTGAMHDREHVFALPPR